MLSDNNKLSEYIKIFPRDKFIREYIDYVWFYSDFSSLGYRFFKSDNWKELYIDQILLKQQSTRSWNFLAFGYFSYNWYIVNLFRLSELKIWDKIKMKFDFYGKWILVVNRLNLWSSIEKVLKFRDMEDLTITRTDYAIDCETYSFRKKNTLWAKIKWRIEKNENLEYILFGRKWKSAKVIRYYDKKKEIEERGTQRLYPDYWGLPGVMRYELQVNSEGFSKDEREIDYQSLKDYCNFWLYIWHNKATHKKKLDQSYYEDIKKQLNYLVKIGDEETIKRLKLYINSIELKQN